MAERILLVDDFRINGDIVNIKYTIYCLSYDTTGVHKDKYKRFQYKLNWHRAMLSLGIVMENYNNLDKSYHDLRFDSTQKELIHNAQCFYTFLDINNNVSNLTDYYKLLINNAVDNETKQFYNLCEVIQAPIQDINNLKKFVNLNPDTDFKELFNTITTFQKRIETPIEEIDVDEACKELFGI